jgi:hypothetical protein
MSYQVKSPFLVPEHSSDDDFAVLQQRVCLRAAEEAEKQTWWDFVVNVAILGLMIAGASWVWELLR